MSLSGFANRECTAHVGAFRSVRTASHPSAPPLAHSGDESPRSKIARETRTIHQEPKKTGFGTGNNIYGSQTTRSPALKSPAEGATTRLGRVELTSGTPTTRWDRRTTRWDPLTTNRAGNESTGKEAAMNWAGEKFIATSAPAAIEEGGGECGPQNVAQSVPAVGPAGVPPDVSFGMGRRRIDRTPNPAAGRMPACPTARMDCATFRSPLFCDLLFASSFHPLQR